MTSPTTAASTRVPSRAPNYCDVLVEALSRYPDRDAFVLGDRRITYAETSDSVSRIQQLLSSLGVSPGTGVGVLSPNAPETFMVKAATILNGGVYSGLHPLGSVSDHVFLCNDAETQVLVVHEHFQETGAAVMAQAATVKHLLVVGSSEAGRDLLKSAAAFDAARLSSTPIDDEATAWLLYTGGTTGVPKGALISHRAYAQQVQSLSASWGLPETPRYLASSPITHAAVLPIVPTLVRGGTVVLQQGFDPQQWLDTVARERINYSFMVPTMLYALMDNTDVAAADISSLETVTYGAAPMSPQRIEEAQSLLGPVLSQAYGQSESVAMATVLRKDEHDPVGRSGLLTSCGRPVLGVRVELLDDNGQPVPDGEVGELSIQSRAVMSGYWKREEETALALKDGWLRTSDLAIRDEDGFFHIVDRKKDMIISGGFNVYPKEIEDVLAGDPSVSAVAVIGVPDPKWGERVMAYVVARPGHEVDVTSLSARVREQKGSHQVPKNVEIVAELPMTAVGKIDKKTLRSSHWSGGGRQVN